MLNKLTLLVFYTALTMSAMQRSTAAELKTLVITETLESATSPLQMAQKTTANTEPPQVVQDLIAYALSHEGAAYRRGGLHPESGFDCSGFVRHVFDHLNLQALPHNANAISKLGTLIHKGELLPGDLVFFKRIRKTITHVGIYLGNNRFVHASSRRTARVMVSNLSDSYWARHFLFGRRLDLQHD